MHSSNHVLITGWSWHAKSIPSCGLQKWEGFAWFSRSVPWCHLLPDLVEKSRGRSLAEKAHRIKTAWTDKQLLQGQTFGTHKDVFPKALLSVSNVAWRLQSCWLWVILMVLSCFRNPLPPLPCMKGQWGCLRRVCLLKAVNFNSLQWKYRPFLYSSTVP